MHGHTGRSRSGLSEESDFYRELNYTSDLTRLRFQPPADNQRGPKYLEGLLAGWTALVGESGVSLGIVSHRGRTEFVVDVPASRQRQVASQLANAHPGSRIEVEDRADTLPIQATQYLRLSPDVLPLRQHTEFIEDHSREAIDPLESLLDAVQSGRGGRVTTEVWLKIKPSDRKHVHRAASYAGYVCGQGRMNWVLRLFQRLCSGRRWKQRVMTWLLSCFIQRAEPVAEITDKLNQHLLDVELQILVRSESRSARLEQRLTSIRATLNQFVPSSADLIVESRPAPFLLTPAEVATLWHPPVSTTIVPRIQRMLFRELEAPAGLASKKGIAGGITLGRVCFRNDRQRVELSLDARRRHLYVVGKTGMGKSTLLQNILSEDIAAGRGCAVIEPHGDLVANVLGSIPKHRTNDVVLFDPSDEVCAIGFNPLQVPPGSDATLVADGVLSAFQKVFSLDQSHAPRLLHILRNSVLSLVEFPGTTLLSIPRLLIDEIYRKSVVASVENPVVRRFWLDEFNKWKPHDRTAFIASLQNKLGAFLSNDKLQRVLGQPDSRLNLRQIMDDGKILIANLSKGRLGENASDLLGTLLVTNLQIAAMTRANVPESERRDFSIVIDEFQNYATPAIATFLSEARKYRTHLVLSHQYTTQLPDDILNAVLGNVGSLLTFQVGADDAERFQREFGGRVTPENLMNIPKYHAYCRLLIDGMPSPAFSIKTLAPRRRPSQQAKTIRERSRRAYGRSVKVVDAIVTRQVA